MTFQSGLSADCLMLSKMGQVLGLILSAPQTRKPVCSCEIQLDHQTQTDKEMF